MRFERIERDVELGGDLAARHPAREVAEHDLLAVAEGVDEALGAGRGRLGGGIDGGEDVLDEPDGTGTRLLVQEGDQLVTLIDEAADEPLVRRELDSGAERLPARR